MWKDPGHPGKGQGHHFFAHGNIPSYKWGWCTVCMNGSQLQLIAGSFPCMRRRCDVMEPAARSTPQSGHGIRLQSLTQYESPNSVNFSAMASSDIPTHNSPEWHVIVRDLTTLATRPYLLKKPTRTFIACCSKYDLRETTMLSSAYKIPRNCPTVVH